MKRARPKTQRALAREETIEYKRWKHTGGKLRRLSPAQCSEKELLAVILNTGTKRSSSSQVAQDLLDRFGTVYDLSGKPISELMEVEGIGPVKATQLAAVFELTKRIIRHIEST
jgi:DNA repair protein RadC